MVQTIATFLTEEEFFSRYRVSRDAARKLRHDAANPLPCFRVGRRYLYDPVKVETWASRAAERARKGNR